MTLQGAFAGKRQQGRVELKPDRRKVMVMALAAGIAQAAPARASETRLIALGDKLLRQNRGRADNAACIAIADYDRPSWEERFHFIDLEKRQARSFRVAHGRGSDPAHSGWLKNFSNQIGSNASSSGAYRVAGEYSGKYGRSLRLIGLDHENSNAERRAIVLHAAWYAEPDIIDRHGKLGRSEGCFTVSEADRNLLIECLPAGSLIIAGKFADAL